MHAFAVKETRNLCFVCVFFVLAFFEDCAFVNYPFAAFLFSLKRMIVHGSCFVNQGGFCIILGMWVLGFNCQVCKVE